MDQQSLGLVFNDAGHAARDIAVWHTLLQSLVTRATGMDVQAYYGEMFRIASARLQSARTTATQLEYVNFMQDWSRELGGVLENDFQEIDLERCSPLARPQIEQAIGHLREQSSSLPGEKQNLSFVAGFLNRDLGPLPRGTLLVRRASDVAVVLHPLAYLRFDDRSGELVNAAGNETVVALEEALRNEVDDVLDAALPALSSLCEALSYVPKAGPVFVVLQGVVDVVQLVRGQLAESDFDRLLRVLPDIMRKALLEANLGSQWGNINQFMDDFKRHCFVLKESNARPQYIKEHFLPYLEVATQLVSGTMGNTAAQLDQMWGKVDWNDIKLKQKLLVAAALASANNALIYRTKVMLLAELAAEAKRKNNPTEYEYQIQAMNNAFHAYNFVVNLSKTSLRELVKKTQTYKEKRFDDASVYWGWKNGFPFYTFYINDKLDGDRDLDWTNFWGPSYDEGEAWAKRRRNELYKQITDEAAKRYLPIITKGMEMIFAFQQLALQMNCKFKLDPDIHYRIVTTNENQAYDVDGGSHEKGSKVILYPYHGHANQLWRFRVVEEADDAVFYQVYAAHSGQCFDIADSTTQQGAVLTQWKPLGGNNQRFKVLNAGEGLFKLQAKHSGQFLTGVAGNVVQRERSDGSEQVWRLGAVSVIQP
ncbi:RICIN domain-containing protein [Chromobacterium subtsugae]|uniref:RICIN domain-containing protein n=1 Tax=Chromobacterium subtsugae TaxID=251747 RepID=UPI0006414A1B|nr:RICIN domain-containing protein [Chromobacterium subtsugae]